MIILQRVCKFHSLIIFYMWIWSNNVSVFCDNFLQMHTCCILRVQRNNSGIYVFLNKTVSLNFFRHWAGNCGLHGEISAVTCWNRILIVQKNKITKSSFYKSGFLKILEKWAEIPSDVKQKIFRQVTEKCVLRVQRVKLSWNKDSNKKYLMDQFRNLNGML